MSGRPSGTVTFIATGIEGSTRLLRQLGDAAYEQALAVYRQVLRGAFDRAGGVTTEAHGDELLGVFASADEALAAAVDAQRKLAAQPFPVRMGVHQGEA